MACGVSRSPCAQSLLAHSRLFLTGQPFQVRINRSYLERHFFSRKKGADRLSFGEFNTVGPGINLDSRTQGKRGNLVGSAHFQLRRRIGFASNGLVRMTNLIRQPTARQLDEVFWLEEE